MEDVLDVYETAYDSLRPVVCMDEEPYQLHGESREPLPMRSGSDQKIDSEYVRGGTCSIFVFTEPLSGVRHVSVRNRRTAVDWAHEIKHLADVCYPEVEKIVLVLDNLNTHTMGSLYKAFPALEARRLAKRFEVHFTPKHGSWLNIAEIELNVMTKQCLSRRIDSIEKLDIELRAWESKRNTDVSKIKWHFTNDQARVKLISLYPKLTPLNT